MRLRNRQVTDRRVICTMLDGMEILCLGIHEGPWPYVVPLNFGYDFTDEALVFYFHCAKEGHKLDLLARDPHVCATAASFISYARGSVKGHLHDYRSVIARGVAERIDPDAEPEAFAHAARQILLHNGRDPQDANTPAIAHVQLWRVRCRPQDVTAKAEITPTCVQEVPFAPCVPDGAPLDERHILDMHKERT